MINIKFRSAVEVNTDPQRRCYNGCHAKSEIQMSAWQLLVYNVKPEEVVTKLKFWRWLNDYAIKDRGESARREFIAVEE